MGNLLGITALTAALVLATVIVEAQPPARKRGILHEIGITAGGLVYQGDLSPSPMGSWKTPGPALSLQATSLRSARTALRAGLLLGRIRGDEGLYEATDYRKERNLSFRTRVVELGVGGLWAPLGGLDGSRRLTPYLAGQGGLALMRVRADWSGMNGAFTPVENSAMLPLIAADAVHRKPGLLPFASLGIGLRRPLGDNWMMTVESGYRWVPSDYIDGFSRLANPDSRDQYAYHSVGLAYLLPGSRRMSQCPKF
ncbi:MAG: hypothetical protein EBZ67_15720 [Chitinophagia bacterium]|nr:hypothetical protein [Chitinophagia bacterium]